MAEYHLILPGKWVDAAAFEDALTCNGSPHDDRFRFARLTLPVRCKVRIDAGTRLLSLANQLAGRGRKLTVEFEEGMDGVMGYLDRIGFFDLLDPAISVIPDPPSRSGYKRRRGNNPDLVEFRPIRPGKRDPGLPKALADALEEACSERDDCTKLGIAAYTVFAELVDNIYEHSETSVDGYAALQVYRKGNRVMVSVSDSGRGILETIRPTIVGRRLKKLSDPELIVHMFNHGLSRFGDDRGCGLRQCADHALKFKSRLGIRLETSSLDLVPSADGYRPNMAYCKTDLPRLSGTHLAFDFTLDS